MSTTSLAAKTCRVGKMSGQPQNALRSLVNAYSAWRLRCRQSAELCGLCDRILKDIGICRTEIEGIVGSAERDASGRVR